MSELSFMVDLEVSPMAFDGEWRIDGSHSSSASALLVDHWIHRNSQPRSNIRMKGSAARRPWNHSVAGDAR
jgi:hypothetical protein